MLSILEAKYTLEIGMFTSRQDLRSSEGINAEEGSFGEGSSNSADSSGTTIFQGAIDIIRNTNTKSQIIVTVIKLTKFIR